MFVLANIGVGVIFKFMLIVCGHVKGHRNTPDVPASHPGYALCSPVVWVAHPAGMESLHGTTVNYISKRHQLACYQQCLCFGMPFTLFTCLRPKLLTAALWDGNIGKLLESCLYKRKWNTLKQASEGRVNLPIDERMKPGTFFLNAA